mgnify:CR=1
MVALSVDVTEILMSSRGYQMLRADEQKDFHEKHTESHQRVSEWIQRNEVVCNIAAWVHVRLLCTYV